MYAYGCVCTPKKIIAHTSYIKYEIGKCIYLYILKSVSKTVASVDLAMILLELDPKPMEAFPFT